MGKRGRGQREEGVVGEEEGKGRWGWENLTNFRYEIIK